MGVKVYTDLITIDISSSNRLLETVASLCHLYPAG